MAAGATTTMTLRLSEGLKARLAELAAKTQRTQSFLAEQAVSAYVDRELEMMTAIDEGFEDYRNNDVVDHEMVKANLATIVAKAREARN